MVSSEPNLYIDEKNWIYYSGQPSFSWTSLLDDKNYARVEYPLVCNIEHIKHITIKPTTLTITTRRYEYQIPHTKRTFEQLKEIMDGK